MGTRTDAALAEVLAARAELDGELVQLEAAGRAAVDIPARVKRAPAQAAGVAAGAAFLALGGPKRLFRRARRAITGKEEELPSELLPKDIEKALKKLGSDGKAVRGTLEREFAKYLDDRAKERKKEGVVAALTTLAVGALRPVLVRGGKQMAERMMNPDGPGFAEQLERVRERAEQAARRDGDKVAGAGAPEDAGL